MKELLFNKFFTIKIELNYRIFLSVFTFLVFASIKYVSRTKSQSFIILSTNLKELKVT